MATVAISAGRSRPRAMQWKVKRRPSFIGSSTGGQTPARAVTRCPVSLVSRRKFLDRDSIFLLRGAIHFRPSSAGLVEALQQPPQPARGSPAPFPEGALLQVGADPVVALRLVQPG